MTLGLLLLYIALTALVLTLAAGFGLKRVQNWPLSYLQFFAGTLFVVSGWVKAIDPLGTAYKMGQYFAAFEGTFEATALSGIAPLFPFLSGYVESFAVIMIVFEIVLGIALIVGYLPRVSAWAFLLLVLFFTVLTGFTYLTGYVPSGVNFFDFSNWGPYVATNMKVTDCGCFGDFLKLEPKVSFLKDVVLLVPAFIFIFGHKHMHQLGTPLVRKVAFWGAVPAFVLYCFSNFVWDLPHTDFRPFKIGVNVREKKAQEMEASQNVKIIAYRLTRKSNGETLELPFDQFLKEMGKYPSDQWDMEQIKSEPAIAPTKISEFEVSNLDGMDVTDELLGLQGYNFMIIAHHLEGTVRTKMVSVPDTTFATDTIRTANSLELVQRVDKIGKRKVEVNAYSWDPEYLKRWKEKVNPAMKAAAEKDIRAVAIVAYGAKEQIEDFKKAAGIDYPVLIADDILLKTIIRSNPGPVLYKDGTIVKKWHIRKFPTFEAIESEYVR